MEIITKRALKNFVTTGAAQDITNISLEKAHKINVSPIFISIGTYGMTGAILKDYNTGKLYAITARNTILFALV